MFNNYFLENPQIEISCEYQKSSEDNSRVSLRTKKYPLLSEKTNFNNDLVKFVSVNATKGIINFYVLINYRKIRSKDKTKDNFLKIALKDVGTNGEKKYKSKIIVNDIKMDFSMNLIQKAMNYTKNHNKSTDIKVAIKPRTVKLEKKDKDKDKREKSFEKKKTGQMKSKMPILKKTVKAVTVINKIRSISSTTRPKKVNTIYKPPPKVQ